MMTIVAADPGGDETTARPDPFGIVGGTLDRRTGSMAVRLAEQHVGRPYPEVAARLARIRDVAKPDLIVVETNNKGRRFIRECGGVVDVVGVHTAAPGVSRKKRLSGRVMDKEAAMFWAAGKIKDGTLRLASGACIGELRKQLQEFRPFRTPGGGTAYRRAAGRHDDLAAAMLLWSNACWAALEAGAAVGSRG